MARPDPGDITLVLSQQQTSVLHYILTRAREDKEFFDKLGGNDPKAYHSFRMVLSHLIKITGD